MPWPSAMRASIGMKWFRSNIKHGSRLALFALVVQFALSFGHFHWRAAQAAPAMQSGLISSVSTADAIGEDAQQPASNHDPDQQRGDVCAICAVLALANAMLFATPPLLLLPQAIEILYLSTGAEFAHLNSACVAFQPRAPPVS